MPNNPSNNQYNNLNTNCFNKIFIVVLCLFVFVGFHQAFEAAVNATFVKWFTDYFHNSLVVSVIFVLVTGGITVYALRRILKTGSIYFRFAEYFTVGIVAGMWVYYRFFNQIWQFYPVFPRWNSSIAYIDIIVGCVVIIALRCAFAGYKKQGKKETVGEKDKKGKKKTAEKADENKDFSLNIDNPILCKSGDLLNRKPFAENLVKEIKRLDTSKGGCSIAVISPWGSGKTSFINLVVEQVENDESFDILHFSPWHLYPQTSITKQFFNQLVAKTGSFNAKLSRFISNYSNVLDGSSYGKFLNFATTSNPSNLFSNISRQLLSSNRKLLIIIDDIDRLNAEEIEEIFRIIKGSANFPNFIFMCALDKNYVLETLKASCSAINATYIEKFFQIEFVLPSFNKDQLQRVAMKICSDFLSAKELEEFKKYLTVYSEITPGSYVFDSFPNLRILYRWLNNIKLGHDLLKGECKIADLADIELLKMQYPQIYSLLKTQYKRYFKQAYSNYALWEEKERVSEEKHSWRYAQAKDLKAEKAYTDIEDAVCREQLNGILERLLPSYAFSARPKHFSNPFYTARYFFGTLLDSDISDIEFKELFDNDLAQIKEELPKDAGWIKARSLILHLEQFETSTEEELLKILKLMFYAPTIYPNYGTSPDKIAEKLQLLSSFPNSNYKTPAAIKQLLIELANENGASNYVRMLFSRSRSNTADWSKYLTDGDIQDIHDNMLKAAIAEHKPSDDIYSFYFYTQTHKAIYNEKTRKNEEQTQYSPKADEMLKEYLATNFMEILPSLIWKNHASQLKNMCYPSNHFCRFWGDWNGFEKYCKENNINIPDSPQTEEFKAFLTAYHAGGEQELQFDFKVIER